MHPGDETSGAHSRPMLAEYLRFASSVRKPRLVRGDVSFGSEEIALEIVNARVRTAVTHAYPDRTIHLTLIDCDDIRCPRRLTRRLIVKNLAQFLGGLSYSVPDESDRLLFARTVWDAYCGHRPTADRSLLVSAASLAIGLYPNRVSQVQTLFRHLE